MCDGMLIRRIAGLFVMLTVVLAMTVSPFWLWATLFVGFNLFQSSLTDLCPLELILGRFRWFGCRPRVAGA